MSRPAAGANGATAAKAAVGPEHDASGLSQTLQGHIDDIRSLIQCGICIRPLYEPFTLACGHTFCYSCLTSWFGTGRSNKTCPDCRSPVKSQPAPAYLVRAVVQLFTSRPELLEKGETTAEHGNNQRAEADRVEVDKKNEHPREGGLFRGTFNRGRPSAQPIVDLEDNVMRCPVCSWELEEDSACEQCGYRQNDGSVSDVSDYLSDSELNSEMTDYMDDELEDGFGGMDDFAWNGLYDGIPVEALSFDIPHQLYGLHRSQHHPIASHRPAPFGYIPEHHHDHWPGDSASSAIQDSEDDSDEDDTDMDSFIDDDEHFGDYGTGSDRSTVVGGPDHTQDHHDDPHSGTEVSVADTYGGLSELESEEDDEDEEDQPIRPATGAIRRRRVPTIHIPSSSPRRPSAHLAADSFLDSILRQNRRPQPSHSTGSSVNNAISLEDDSDEGPVGPTRRARGRGNRC
ncbi:hypothetical protein P168DRAFT_292252 [Aspergillus campestris IBT 28561]|uniref:RING-type domain-containing protein n=1 Tax=Aspergillus campestris (strain IBT 28561) TaxID=1392248 RepID=A0A2I1CX02_ASPC2|nr:uncharacterized protein P168DRAFT_292252 [Aspergillus campestris IBT 28561]PKY02151.1 hypothetical protein P168DRAFT_292252 [Aspergillus campestris IBT 28561]